MSPADFRLAQERVSQFDAPTSAALTAKSIDAYGDLRGEAERWSQDQQGVDRARSRIRSPGTEPSVCRRGHRKRHASNRSTMKPEPARCRSWSTSKARSSRGEHFHRRRHLHLAQPRRERYPHGTGNALDVFYTYKPCSSSCTASGWRQPIPIHSNTTRDQFMPGLDFDLTGRVLITYYDFRGSATQYHEFFSYLTADGTRVHDDVQMSVTASAPASLPNFGVVAGRHFIGDYQEVWEDTYPEGERATAGWISITSTYTDVLFTRILY